MRKKCILLSILFTFLGIAGYFVLSKKLTYIETSTLTFIEEDILCIDSPELALSEEITMPYDMLRSIALRITNYRADNNSKWKLLIQDAEQTTVFSKDFRFIDAADNNLYTIDFGKSVRFDKGSRYTVSFIPEKIDPQYPLGFYRGYQLNKFALDSDLSVGGIPQEGALCLSLYGSDYDSFWFSFYIFVLFILYLFSIRICFLHRKGIRLYDDRLSMSILCGIIVFLVCLPFANSGNGFFTDENDNIRGGMIIARGGILYKDYVTQHTPVAYYLCALFAKLGASSITQIRLLFHFFLSILWGFLYYRHCFIFGKAVTLSLPPVILLCLQVLIGPYCVMAVAEVLQSTALIALLLEFVHYTKDSSLSCGRSIVISLFAWLALGSVFMSLYALFFLFLLFCTYEILYWKKNSCSALLLIKRYWFFLLCTVLPGILGILYFKVNHSLYYAYYQMYLFNREVYPHYQDMGKSIPEPFISGLSSMFEQYTSSFLAFGNSMALTAAHILSLLLITIYVALIIKKVHESPVSCLYYIGISLMICAGAARGAGDWHGQSFWGMLVALVLISIGQENISSWFQNKYKIIVSAIILCFLLTPYLAQVHANTREVPKPVTYLDPVILEQLDENEDLFIDAYFDDSIYLMTKGHFPVNRAVYCLPWYMDWYEEWNITDLKEKEPDIVVWNMNQDCWLRTHYAVALSNYISDNYEEIADGASIWRRKK